VSVQAEVLQSAEGRVGFNPAGWLSGASQEQIQRYVQQLPPYKRLGQPAVKIFSVILAS